MNMNVPESNIFFNSAGKKDYVISHSFHCNEQCITYFLTCNKCKLQHAGKTVNDFRLRSNNYKNNNRKYLRKEVCMHQHFFEHFLSEGHSGFIDDLSITFIEKTIPKDPSKR